MNFKKNEIAFVAVWSPIIERGLFGNLFARQNWYFEIKLALDLFIAVWLSF